MSIWLPSALFLVCCCHVASPCPDQCKCYISPRKTEVVCNNVPLTQFPSVGLPANTTSLTVQYTNVSSISELHLSAAPLLRELYLYNNNLSSLPADLFRGSPLLSTVALSDNRLDRLPANVFAHAPLQSLVLKNNLMVGVEAEWLPDNSNLTWLDLSGNRLRDVPGALFQKLRRLENLDLSHNRLTHLFLLENRLEQLPSTLFQGLPNLQHLSLDNNRLSHVPPGLLDQLHSIVEEGLDITGNPWMCDKKVEYLWRWVKKNQKKMFMANDIRCASPDALKERSVMSLNESDVGL